MPPDTWMLQEIDLEGLDDKDIVDTDNQEQECGIEPNRPLACSEPYGFTDDADSMTDVTLHDDPFWVRDGAEDALGQKPFVIKFPNPDASWAYQGETLDANNQYMQALRTSLDNPYEPFLSRRD